MHAFAGAAANDLRLTFAGLLNLRRFTSGLAGVWFDDLRQRPSGSGRGGAFEGGARWRLGQFAGADLLDFVHFRAAVDDHVVDAGGPVDVDGLVDDDGVVDDHAASMDGFGEVTEFNEDKEPVRNRTIAVDDIAPRSKDRAGRQRRPTTISAPFAPADPGRAPLGVRHPDPAFVGVVRPATIVVRGPSPRFAADPVPAAVRPHPVALAVRVPIRRDVRRVPATSVPRPADPVAAGSERAVEDADRPADARARLAGRQRQQYQRCTQ